MIIKKIIHLAVSFDILHRLSLLGKEQYKKETSSDEKNRLFYFNEDINSRATIKCD